MLEYSVSENSHHIFTVAQMLENNHSNVEKRISKDFVPIALTYSYEQAVAWSKELGKIIDNHVSSGNQLIHELELSMSVADTEQASDESDSEP